MEVEDKDMDSLAVVDEGDVEAVTAAPEQSSNTVD